MKSYKLLALDMDGTLLNSQKRVSPRTAQALTRLADRGIPLAFCTGRNRAELGMYLQELSFIRYGVLVSGSIVRDMHTGEIVTSQPLQTSMALHIARVGRCEDAMIHVLCVDQTLIAKKDMNRLEDVEMEVYRPLFMESGELVDDVMVAMSEHEDILKVNLYHTSVESRARSRARLSTSQIVLADSETTSLECTAQGVSKAAGLRGLCAHMGISLEETVMIGDADNDLDALRAVGMPVAMGNAVPEVVRASKLQVADCDHDGIVEAVDRLFP